MSTTAINTGLTAVNTSMAVIAQQAAAQARSDRCVVLESQFDVVKASTGEKQEYAACVEVLYPQPVDHSETMLIKGGILVLLISLVAGAIHGWRQDRNLESTVMFGLGAFIVSFCAIAFLALLTCAVMYLFS